MKKILLPFLSLFLLIACSNTISEDQWSNL